jgi:hypothetical protein
MFKGLNPDPAEAINPVTDKSNDENKEEEGEEHEQETAKPPRTVNLLKIY